MKILKYILFVLILIILYITEPLWRPQASTHVTEVPQMDKEISVQEDKREGLNTKETDNMENMEKNMKRNRMLDLNQVSKNL